MTEPVAFTTNVSFNQNQFDIRSRAEIRGHVDIEGHGILKGPACWHFMRLTFIPALLANRPVSGTITADGAGATTDHH
jgi:hypothetical protein